jgi:hypothetical protein
MSRSDAAQTEENAPMLKWLVLPMTVFAYLAATVIAAAPRDRDHDRLPDRWERSHGLSAAKASARRDPDRDRLINRRELRLRTHPRRADTDRDHLRDGVEVRRLHTNPRRRDTDGDGFRDRCELRKGTNPRKRRSRPKRRCSKSPPAPRSAPSPAPPGESPTPPGGRPDASNTGVPAGVTLTQVTADPLRITQAGTVVSGREFLGKVEVAAPNVTIRNSRFRDDGWWQVHSQSTGLVIEDSEFIGTVPCHNSIGYGNFTVRRSEFTGCENAADVGDGNVVFADSWVHDLETEVAHPDSPFDSPHTDGIQGVDLNVRITHNTIDPVAGGGGTSAIIMNTNGAGRDVWIEDNYLDGRGTSYALYANRQPSTNVNINRNQMVRGAFGYTACMRPGVTVTQFNDNRDATTGAGIAPDNGAGGSCSN